MTSLMSFYGVDHVSYQGIPIAEAYYEDTLVWKDKGADLRLKARWVDVGEWHPVGRTSDVHHLHIFTDQDPDASATLYQPKIWIILDGKPEVLLDTKYHETPLLGGRLFRSFRLESRDGTAYILGHLWVNPRKIEMSFVTPRLHFMSKDWQPNYPTSGNYMQINKA